MRIAHIEAIGGISGNMLLGAFLDAGVAFEDLEPPLRSLVAEGWRMERHQAVRRGISATHVDFAVDNDLSERRLADVLRIVDESQLTARQKRRACSVYQRLAVAEAKVHGTSVDEIHFHEVGAVDAILDVAATCIALDVLQIDRLSCSAIPLGRGWVRMQHGNYPNPPPATAELLLDIPTFDGFIEAELVTPTGAALVSGLCAEFGRRPAMTMQAIGYGAGTMDLDIPNVTRICVGVAATAAADAQDPPDPPEVVVLEANIDDMLPQFYELAVERIFAAGARDVWLTPIIMKKGRPAITLSAISTARDETAVARAILRETTTIGVRVRTERKHLATREADTSQTEFGLVRTKRCTQHDGEVRITIEYDDLVRIARREGLPIAEVAERVKADVG